MTRPTISLIIPTVSRPTLARTLASVRRQDWWPGDEVIIVGDGPQAAARPLWEQFGLPGYYCEVRRTDPPDWGHTPRNRVMPLAKGQYLMALDDDDEMATDAIKVVRAALERNPGRPHLFRMHQCHTGAVVWADREIREGNVGTPMLVCPNDPEMYGQYTSRYGGDFDFILSTCSRYAAGPVWHEAVICRVRPPR